LEPAFGWPYRRLLAKRKRPADQPPPAPKELARRIVDEYVKHYADYDRTAGRSADLSATDLTQLDAVAGEFKELAAELKKLDKAGHERVLLAHWYAQTFKFDQFVDLADLCVQIMERFPASDVATKCVAVLHALDECIISSGCTGFAYQHSHGVSIYFPWAFVSPDYQELEFAKEWASFLDIHIAATRREHRFGAPAVPAGLLPKSLIDERKDKRREGLRQLKEHCLKSSEPGSAAYGDRQPAQVVAKGDGGADEAIKRQFKVLLQSPSVVGARIDEKLNRAIDAVGATDVLDEDIALEITERFLRGTTFGAHNSRYTGGGSRYTGGGSKYTGGGSKYTGGGSRSPGDREKSMKNLPAVIGNIVEAGVGKKIKEILWSLEKSTAQEV
jgi:hypothetical protein